MPYKIIQIQLTDAQVEAIEKGIGTVGDDENYALLAEPKLTAGKLNVQVVTTEQYAILRPAITAAHKLPQWKPGKAGAK
jgi:hypothetical protein